MKKLGNKPKILTKDKLIKSIRLKILDADGKYVFSKVEVEMLLMAVIETIREMLVENYKVKLEGLGSFFCERTKQRKRYNPNTGKEDIYPSRRIVKFKYFEKTQVDLRELAEEYDEKLRAEEQNG